MTRATLLMQIAEFQSNLEKSGLKKTESKRQHQVDLRSRVTELYRTCSES